MPARSGDPRVDEVADGVWRVRDTCNVYLIEADSAVGGDGTSAGDSTAHERTGIAIDFGSGLVLDVARDRGIRITDVLMTHHHRDQGQGLPLAAAAGIRIHVPPVEVELFSRVEEMWESRQLVNDYNLRQDRFSLLESVPVHGVVPEYRSARFGGVAVRTIPTPGHTVGSVTYLLERDAGRIAFTGDLIYAPGKVWSLAATQWSYSGQEGSAMSALSAWILQREEPTLILPSHGDPMPDADSALGMLGDALQDYVDSRREQSWDLRDRLDNPWRPITEHLILNRSSLSCSYALLSTTGEALFVDFGYDMTTGLSLTSERSARRPWLASLPSLKSQYGVSRVSVALPTHYHDDHVGGLPLLRDVEGTELWIPSTVAPVLADPELYDLPCQWYEPIPADRVLAVGEPFTWNEYTITAHELPGHTLFAVAYEVEVDGVTVLFTGDQQVGNGSRDGEREILNYQYRNRFGLGDYQRSAALYRRVAPGVLVSGHWQPRWVEEGYLDYLAEEGANADELHERLLPLDELGIPVDGVVARILPYRSRLERGRTQHFEVVVQNPLDERAAVTVSLVAPGWMTEPESSSRTVDAGETATFAFAATAPGTPARRARIAADITVGDRRFGQHAEAIVDVG